MKHNGSLRRLKISADGAGVVSHAGVGMLRELAEGTGLVGSLDDALMDTYKGVPVHAPGWLLSDLAVAVADGADAISGIAVLTDRQDVFGPVASMPTALAGAGPGRRRSLPGRPGRPGGRPGTGLGCRCRPGGGR